MRWVMWENKSQHENLKKLGSISGYLEECVSQGSKRRGYLKDESSIPKHEDNQWALDAENVFISGRMTKDNVDTLIEVAEAKPH